MPASGEGVGDQAGPEQENTCRRQCKKAVRDEVLIAHLTVSVLVRSGQKSSEKTLSQDMVGLALLRGLVPGANALKCMSQEDPGAHQTHQCCYRVDHFSGPLHPRATQPNDVDPYTVKMISGPKPRSETTDVFVQQVCQSGNARTPRAQGMVNHARGLPIFAAIGLRYRGALVARGAPGATGFCPT